MSGCGPCRSNAAACEANATVGPRLAAPRHEVVCRNEALTGSHIVERRCYRLSDIEERSARDRAVMERLIIEANRPVRRPASVPASPH